jgi:hypothetical protein
MARKDRINQKPLHNPSNPPLIKENKPGLLFIDVNITTKKVNEKNPLDTFYPEIFIDKRALFRYGKGG